MHPSRTLALLALAGGALAPAADAQQENQAPAKNAIFFVGDGMGVSTITATRIFSVGIEGELTVDQAPFTALSKTYTSDHITPDSAGTMTAMMTGVNTNSGVIGFGPDTERKDFLGNGDGAPLSTILEQAKASGKLVGVVTTARSSHATPAACYAKSNERNNENDIVLQLLPTDPNFNPALGNGVDVIFGGGRRHYIDNSITDEEGSTGRRSDGRDLRAEFQAAGYTYVWNQTGFDPLTSADLPILGLFESSHMEYEYDRPTDLGGEPSIQQMTEKAIEVLSAAAGPNGYFLMVESGRIDHAHHASNAYRSLVDTEEFDQAINAALQMVDLNKTLVLVTADHSHVFNIAGYPLRPQIELPYPVAYAPLNYMAASRGNLMTTVFDLNSSTGGVEQATDVNGVPYTTLVYGNGGGHRTGGRVDPWSDPFPGFDGNPTSGPEDPNWLQESAVPLFSETHSGEEVAVYAWGPMAQRVRGTGKNTGTYFLMKFALGL